MFTLKKTGLWLWPGPVLFLNRVTEDSFEPELGSSISRGKMQVDALEMVWGLSEKMHMKDSSLRWDTINASTSANKDLQFSFCLQNRYVFMSVAILLNSLQNTKTKAMVTLVIHCSDLLLGFSCPFLGKKQGTLQTVPRSYKDNFSKVKPVSYSRVCADATDEMNCGNVLRAQEKMCMQPSDHWVPVSSWPPFSAPTSGISASLAVFMSTHALGKEQRLS